jgi:TolB protein
MKFLILVLLAAETAFGQPSTKAQASLKTDTSLKIQTSSNNWAYGKDLEKQMDVGKPKLPGSLQINEATQTYKLTGAGYNVWFNRDEFTYVPTRIFGDFILTTNLKFSDTAGNAHKKAGWMIRESLDETAAHVSAVVHKDGLITMQARPLRGAFMRDPQDEIRGLKKHADIIQLERSGKTFIMRIANTGEPLQEVARRDYPDMPDTLYAGLFVCSHDADRREEAQFWNVRIDKPVGDNYSTSKSGFIGCRLETIDVFTGIRNVIHESKGRFEAPNWMPDNKSLLFNENGSLYTIPVTGGEPVKLNTGAVDRNNNDHGISFNGKMLAISSHRNGLPGGGSSVYILPLSGGEPALLTEKTPSYWHGWAPDGSHVLYVGMRDGKNYNIFRKSIKGGEEVALTQNTNHHVDGPEYSPDGKYIYYNSSPTGTMQVWRMKPDGSGKEQVTFDENNNWFPHISPDGKWIAYISFPPVINPSDHPSYKRVTLMLMPATGGAARAIAYLYGGQGTINVPSWAPDSKRLAFVSNSRRYPDGDVTNSK